jgi:hypothetical protein
VLVHVAVWKLQCPTIGGDLAYRVAGRVANAKAQLA